MIFKKKNSTRTHKTKQPLEKITKKHRQKHLNACRERIKELVKHCRRSKQKTKQTKMCADNCAGTRVFVGIY